jgi:hypothetical protein
MMGSKKQDYLPRNNILEGKKLEIETGTMQVPLTISIQIVNFLIEFVGALYCFCILQNFSKNTLDNFNANLF